VKLSNVGLDLIKQFEGLRLIAYKDVAGIETVGYGHTGSDVYPGLKITEEKAQSLLLDDTQSAQNCVNNTVQVNLNQNEFDALVSFVFNIGITAFSESTLLKKLNAGNDKTEVASEFSRWVKAGSDQPVPGLVKRREKEKELFLTQVKHPLLAKSILALQDTWLKRKPLNSSSLEPEDKLFVPKGSAWEWSEIRMYAGEQHHRIFLTAKADQEWWIWPEHWKIINDVETTDASANADIKLKTPYYSQRDNYRDASRTCFSSSCAMLLSTLKPSAISDTTESSVQIQALKYFGVESTFSQNASWDTIEAQLAKGIPVPIGILHHGPVSAPSGGGHWIVAYGVTSDRSKLWVQDPWGELDLVSGKYISQNGAGLLYSKKNLGPRWLVEGSNSGWCILAS
jgi:lysozyme